ncbi:MAG TPA: phenylacetate--CoA ligase family protein [Candidatus Dormibacteraeota bacterium]|nr:phenylacetate--CoA ligase family protein [Candidatus Dormibacteraeota bacterium]
MTETPLHHPDHRRLHFVPPPLRSAAAALTLRAADATKWSALRSFPLFLSTATMPIPRWVEPLGARAALRAALHAQRRVPAYADFVEANGWSDDPGLPGAERLARLPIMDKRNYILRYTTPERCLDGRIPLVGTEMDESSGSSGVPYNWVRGAMELDEVHRQLAMFATYVFREPVVTVNCFSMGAWSTGINTAQALRRTGLVKSPGPDLEKVLHTLAFLGPGYPYVLTGYPPFLREVLEYGDERGFDWRPYRLFGVVGGESMSEQLRDRLLTRFIAVYSAYGASDLDIGVAAETPLTVHIRREAATNPGLRRALFGDDPRLPMVFQYNPLDYNVEVIDGELVVTVCRLCMLSPRIRYNIHDAGGAHSYNTLVEICRDFGIDVSAAPTAMGRRGFQLPLLFVHGRSDATISYMGANIYPEDVEQALHADSRIAEDLGAFCLELKEIGDGAVRPCVHVEVRGDHAGSADLSALLRQQIVDRLLRNSQDFRAAVAENPTAAEVLVELHEPGSGPFAENSRRIKRRYIVTAS